MENQKLESKKLWILLDVDLVNPYILKSDDILGQPVRNISPVIVFGKTRVEAKKNIHALMKISDELLLDPRIVEVKSIYFKPPTISYD